LSTSRFLLETMSISLASAKLLAPVAGAGLVAFFAHAAPAMAGSVTAITFTGVPPQSSIPGSPYVLGYHFTTDLDSKLNSVGIFKPTSDNHSIGLWDFTDSVNPSLIFSKDLLSSDSCVIESSFCWITLPSSLSLSKNVDYVIASTWGSESVPARLTSGDTTLTPGFRLNQSATTDPGTISTLLVDFVTNPVSYAPTQTASGYDAGFITVNMRFETDSPSPSQVPAPLPLFGAAAAFGMSRKIRRRISSAS